VSLGKQIEPYLPLLRRYAALLTGGYLAGDILVTATLEAIVADPKRIERGNVRGALYRVFEETAQASPEEDEDDRPPLSPAYQWLARLPPLVRKATLLVCLEGFTTEEASRVLDLPIETLDGLVGDAVAATRAPLGLKVMLVEPEPLIAMMMSDLLGQLGHTAVGIAKSEREAVAMALRLKPDILVTETILEPGAGLAAAAKAAQGHRSTLVVATASPQIALEADSPASYAALVAKPFAQQTFRAAIIQAAFIARHGQVPPVEADAALAREASIIDASPVAFAPTVAVTENGLALSDDGGGEQHRAMKRMDALRVDHADDAARLARLGHNLGGAFGARMSRVADLLSEPLNDARALRIANQAQALASLKAKLNEELLPIDAADATAFIDALGQFAKQLPAWREFLHDAARSPYDERVEPALAGLGKAIETSPELVSPDLAEAVAEARLEPGVPDPARLAYLQGLLHNVFGAIGKYLLERHKGIAAAFNKKVDEAIGGGLAAGLGQLMVAASTPLLAMATAIPAQWWWVGPALAAARIAAGRK